MSRAANARVMLTVDEFLVYDVPDGKAELVRGELRMSPSPGGRHGAVVTAITRRLLYLEDRGLGRLLSNAGFELVKLPKTVRAPDLAFVRADHLPPGGIGDGPMQVSPDLAVEVVSPSDTHARIRERLDDYRTSSVPLVWLVDPRRRTVTVIEGDRPPLVLGEQDALDGGTVIPDLRCKVGEFFQGLSP